mmetsp:Transcript_40336/g.61549  ORF Transcript_40336/g.61549 Transcript_40336/m.61549 type:complete len:337 (+) Transcript_40336:455-1465(+)|eukprot:CAMPEP_0170485384 /NCGR_PEP_ID=MMETSP0208-20121228/4667_1 /TAXON_ID=197538 /ORGANISM="Strombidium inclinatum, Strain S3" /LENGTH=336 /DNA_ID=CAMNT_0010759021 /DNA_START=430 /DNA_END=1440 /DNA_ORIENTATION=-
MVGVAFVVELVLEQFILALFDDVLLALEVLVLLLLLVEDVARVVSAGRGPVLRPLDLAQPAEVVLALLAGHVVAALVLLDARRALRAGLGVRSQPSHVLSVAGLLEKPLLLEEAGRWLVLFLVALEAEGESAAALDEVLDFKLGDVDHLVALFVWTPVELPVEVSELLDVPPLVLLQSALVRVDILLEERVGHLHVALQLGAGSEHASWTIALNLALQEMAPASHAELVLALQRKSLQFWLVLFESAEANAAHPAVVLSPSGVNVFVLLLQLDIEFDPHLAHHDFRLAVEPAFLDLLLVPVELTQDSYDIVLMFEVQDIVQFCSELRNLLAGLISS